MGILTGNCDRCKKPFGEHSYFSEYNNDLLCKKCYKKQKRHPLYKKAVEFSDKHIDKFVTYLTRGIEIAPE